MGSKQVNKQEIKIVKAFKFNPGSFGGILCKVKKTSGKIISIQGTGSRKELEKGILGQVSTGDVPYSVGMESHVSPPGSGMETDL